MNNKKLRERFTIIAIVILLLVLAVGIVLLTQNKRGLVSKDTDKTKKELTMTIEDKDTTIIWEKEEFQDETTDKVITSNAGEKGGSETLEVILPKDADTEGDSTSEKTGIKWIPGIW